jgi:hypothetical protein
MEIGSVLLILWSKIVLIRLRMSTRTSIIITLWFERRNEDLEDELEED